MKEEEVVRCVVLCNTTSFTCIHRHKILPREAWKIGRREFGFIFFIFCPFSLFSFIFFFYYLLFLKKILNNKIIFFIAGQRCETVVEGCLLNISQKRRYKFPSHDMQSCFYNELFAARISLTNYLSSLSCQNGLHLGQI